MIMLGMCIVSAAFVIFFGLGMVADAIRFHARETRE